ncbi:MAG: ATP-dependent DNA helicase [Bdellovibrionaceae bacterium]|nr:ATP-dependent DNA helicase [Pseudobdellovibrionaceae bacterium]|tara:strand:- start:554 stop:2581 length:2028 start_codon:yes stop_codon:yes gene_type:complete
MNSEDKWLKDLNPEQREAAKHNEGPLLILAGAGSGKTTVLVARTGRLIDEKVAKAERICVLTFTNKAAFELKSRVVKKIGPQAKKVWTGTFHGFGLQFLKEFWKEAELPKRFGVIDASDSMAVLKDLMRDHSAYEKERFSMERLMAKISTLRQTGRESSLDDTIESSMALVLAPKYIRKLKHLGVVDFEELLLRPLRLMKENEAIHEKMRSRYDFLMVDEFQDTNNTQMKLIDELTSAHRNIAVVGDDDQSIYGWRGAEIQNILGFPKRFENCVTIRLERNYRSSGRIIELANGVISNNDQRHEKILRPGLANEGEKPEVFVFENENDEVEQVVSELMEFSKKGYSFRDIAILYRSNSQGGLLEGGLRRANIPYKITGGTALFDRKEVKDVLALIRSSLFPTEVSFRRIINTPPRGVGEKTLEAIESLPSDLDFYRKSKEWVKENSEEKAAKNIQELFEFLQNLKHQLVKNPKSAEDVLLEELDRLGYRKFVFQNYREAQVAEKRWFGVMILGRILDGMFGRHGRSYETLDKFIDAMELRDPVEQEGDTPANEVQMMTLHACKGLEFPLVFLVGVEEELLPHSKLGQDVSEERRLFYVGVTRAKKHLILTRVRARKRHGKLMPVSPSRFLVELDPALYEELNGGRPLAQGQRESMMADLYKKLNAQIKANEAEGV